MLQTVKYVLLFFIGVSAIWLIIKMMKTKQPKKVFLWSAVSGLVALGVMGLLGKFASPIIHINLYSVGTATSLGVPGVILMIITKLLWQL